MIKRSEGKDPECTKIDVWIRLMCDCELLPSLLTCTKVVYSIKCCCAVQYISIQFYIFLGKKKSGVSVDVQGVEQHLGHKGLFHLKIPWFGLFQK